MSSFKKNTIFNVIYNVANIIFPLITSMYVSRILLDEGIGQVAYAQNIASYFVTFAALGIPTYGIREVAKVRNNKIMTNKLFTELFVINFVSTIIAFFSYLFLVLSFSDFRDDFLLFLCCGIPIFMNFFNVDWFYQGNEKYVYIAIRSVAIKILLLVFVIFFVKTREDYILYALITSLALCFNYIFNVVHIRKYVRFDFSELQFKRHFKPIFILAISIFLSSIYSKVDVTMLGVLSTQSAIGIYNNAHKVVEMIIMVATSISAVFLPRLSYFYKENRVEFYRLIEVGINILAFLTFPMMIGVFILAPEIIVVMFGNAFLDGGTTIRIFSVLILIKSFGNLLCYQLVIATGNEKKRLPAYVGAAISNVVLNLLLIPILGQNGAAIASVISEVIVNGYQTREMKRILGFKIPVKVIIQGVLSSTIMGIVVLYVVSFVTASLTKCIIGVIAGVISYVVVNLLIKNEMCLYVINFVKERLNVK